MKIIRIPLEFRCGSKRRTVFLREIGLDNLEAFQIVDLKKLKQPEPFHTNRNGAVRGYNLIDKSKGKW